MKQSKIVRHWIIPLEAKNRVLNTYVIFNLLHDSECFTIFSRQKGGLESTKMWLYRNILRKAGTENGSKRVSLRQQGNNQKESAENSKTD